MTQLKVIAKRLKRPSVIISIVSQVILLLILLHVEIDHDLAMAVTATISSILVTLGILSNPDSNNKGYGDDLLLCKDCKSTDTHVQIGDKMVCTKCGAVRDSQK